MENNNWNSTALIAGISVFSGVVLIGAFIGILSLPLLGQAGLALWLILLALTMAVSRLTVTVTSTDGARGNRKSIADTFVFLAVMLYAIPPVDSVGPAVVLAAIVGFFSTFRFATQREIVFTTGMAVISTFLAASLYGLHMLTSLSFSRSYFFDVILIKAI